MRLTRIEKGRKGNQKRGRAVVRILLMLLMQALLTAGVFAENDELSEESRQAYREGPVPVIAEEVPEPVLAEGRRYEDFISEETCISADAGTGFTTSLDVSGLRLSGDENRYTVLDYILGFEVSMPEGTMLTLTALRGRPGEPEYSHYFRVFESSRDKVKFSEFRNMESREASFRPEDGDRKYLLSVDVPAEAADSDLRSYVNVGMEFEALTEDEGGRRETVRLSDGNSFSITAPSLSKEGEASEEAEPDGEGKSNRGDEEKTHLDDEGKTHPDDEDPYLKVFTESSQKHLLTGGESIRFFLKSNRPYRVRIEKQKGLHAFSPADGIEDEQHPAEDKEITVMMPEEKGTYRLCFIPECTERIGEDDREATGEDDRKSNMEDDSEAYMEASIEAGRNRNKKSDGKSDSDTKTEELKKSAVCDTFIVE